MLCVWNRHAPTDAGRTELFTFHNGRDNVVALVGVDLPLFKQAFHELFDCLLFGLGLEFGLDRLGTDEICKLHGV